MQAVLAAAPSLSGEGTMADSLGPDATAHLAHSWAKVDPAILTMGIEATAEEDPFEFTMPIGCPVTVVRADPGSWAPCLLAEHEEPFRRLAPQAQFVVVQGASHLLHIEQPDPVTLHIDNFLSTCPVS